MIACFLAEVVGKRQLEALAVVEVVVIDEAVVQICGGGVDGGADAGDAVAEDYLAGANGVGAGIATADGVVTVAAIEIEVLEFTIDLEAYDGTLEVSACINFGTDDHTVPNSGTVTIVSIGTTDKCTITIYSISITYIDRRADQADVFHQAIFDIAEESVRHNIIFYKIDLKVADGITTAVVGTAKAFRRINTDRHKANVAKSDIAGLAEGLTVSDALAAIINGRSEVLQVALVSDGVGGGATLNGHTEEVAAELSTQLVSEVGTGVVSAIGGCGHYDISAAAECAEGIAADDDIGAADINARDAGSKVSGPRRGAQRAAAAQGQAVVRAVAIAVAHAPCQSVAARAADGEQGGADGDVAAADGDSCTILVGCYAAARSTCGGERTEDFVGWGSQRIGLIRQIVFGATDGGIWVANADIVRHTANGVYLGKRCRRAYVHSRHRKREAALVGSDGGIIHAAHALHYATGISRRNGNVCACDKVVCVVVRSCRSSGYVKRITWCETVISVGGQFHGNVVEELPTSNIHIAIFVVRCNFQRCLLRIVLLECHALEVILRIVGQSHAEYGSTIVGFESRSRGIITILVLARLVEITIRR